MQFFRRRIQQVPQHRNLCRDPRVKRGIHIGSEQRRVIRRKLSARRFSCSELLRVCPTQTEIKARNTLIDEIGEIL